MQLLIRFLVSRQMADLGLHLPHDFLVSFLNNKAKSV